jgi:hypothetical protein
VLYENDYINFQFTGSKQSMHYNVKFCAVWPSDLHSILFNMQNAFHSELEVSFIAEGCGLRDCKTPSVSKITVFWDVMLYYLVERCLCCGGTCLLHLMCTFLSDSMASHSRTQ